VHQHQVRGPIYTRPRDVVGWLHSHATPTDDPERIANTMEAPMPDDRQLVAQAQAGDYDAFETLVTRHERRLYALALQITRNERDAEDVVQTAFLKALENLNDFRGEAAFGTWITRIATHAALRVLRGRKGMASVAFGGDATPDNGGDDTSAAAPHPECIQPWCLDPHETIERSELARLLDEAIEQLPPKLRVVFVLRDIQKLSTQETADALDISPANVKVRLMRARMALREMLTERLADPQQPPLEPAHE
jgi:RNA polymerase sigma-70 factor (ECF subfamily)